MPLAWAASSAKGLTLEILHHEEIAAGGFADVINGADVGVIQRRGGTSFALEPLERHSIFGQFFGEKFESDKAP